MLSHSPPSAELGWALRRRSGCRHGQYWDSSQLGWWQLGSLVAEVSDLSPARRLARSGGDHSPDSVWQQERFLGSRDGEAWPAPDQRPMSFRIEGGDGRTPESVLARRCGSRHRGIEATDVGESAACTSGSQATDQCPPMFQAGLWLLIRASVAATAFPGSGSQSKCRIANRPAAPSGRRPGDGGRSNQCQHWPAVDIRFRCSGPVSSAVPRAR